MSFMQWTNETTIKLIIRVAPGARKTAFGEIINDVLRVYIKAQPTDNEANEALIKFLSKEFKTPQSKIAIISGTKSKNKIIEISEPRKIPEIQPSNPGLDL